MMRKIGLTITCMLALICCAAAPVVAKEIRLAFDSDPVSLDPHMQLSGGMLMYSHQVFDPLVRWTQEMDFEPRLAESWERIDELTMRFHLRKGVTFHSGNPFTAKDVAWTLNRLKVSQDFRGLFEAFAEARPVDDHTVDIITHRPYGLVLSLATYIFPMDSVFYSGTDEQGQPKDMIAKTGPSFANANASGTGPFRVTARQHGVRTVFDRFGDYWDKKSPGNVTRMVLTPIRNDATRVAALLSGDVDFIVPVPPQDQDRIERHRDVKLVTMSGTRIITLQMNQKRRPEFQDVRVRQAIVHAVNNQGIVDRIMRGRATVAAQQSPKGYSGYNESLVPRYDLEKARQLMKEAGYEKGFEVTMVAPNDRYVNDARIAEAVVPMLARINIRVNLQTMPKAQYWDEFDAQVADIQLIGWHSDTEDSGNFTEYLAMCPSTETGYGQYNSGNYCNPRVDELALACQTETDMEKRNAMLREIERILYEDAAFVPLHWQDLSWAARNNLEIETIVNVQDFPYFGDLVVH
ncbi:ABC transporter substrate-binding protein [Desulfobotulus sp. H1]|uniref:ABC transporter substrate-binding protein n=1 Tax=Desulfobotulus pelophilus TaxID=2823377 RepID=A0ABT3NBC7_9BACT|nr:ABC transporter substrate-binding protein [Desulfobotulus pelophilus]MCW7754766.1 ABC transporter substrate-binding protein [Desulfobotulus pelophilus]